MKNKALKLKLSDIKLESFVTSMENENRSIVTGKPTATNATDRTIVGTKPCFCPATTGENDTKGIICAIKDFSDHYFCITDLSTNNIFCWFG